MAIKGFGFSELIRDLCPADVVTKCVVEMAEWQMAKSVQMIFVLFPQSFKTHCLPDALPLGHWLPWDYVMEEEHAKIYIFFIIFESSGMEFSSVPAGALNWLFFCLALRVKNNCLWEAPCTSGCICWTWTVW